MEIDVNDLAEAAYQEIDGLMVLVQDRERIDFLTGTQLFFLLQPIRDHLENIRDMTAGPSPSIGAAAVLQFSPHRR